MKSVDELYNTVRSQQKSDGYQNNCEVINKKILLVMIWCSHNGTDNVIIRYDICQYGRVLFQVHVWQG